MPRVALCGWTLAPGMTPMSRSICPNYFSELESCAKSCVADGCDTAGGVRDLPVTTVFAVVRDCGGRGSGRRGWCPDVVRRRSVR